MMSKGPVDESRCGRPRRGIPKGVFWLRRPLDTTVAAIVQKLPNGTVTLNPPGFDYGPIPALEKMTQEHCEWLWGSSPQEFAPSQKLLIKEYRLVSPDGSTDFFIDVKFDRDRLIKYRVRSTLIEPMKWCTVANEERP